MLLLQDREVLLQGFLAPRESFVFQKNETRHILGLSGFDFVFHALCVVFWISLFGMCMGRLILGDVVNQGSQWCSSLVSLGFFVSVFSRGCGINHPIPHGSTPQVVSKRNIAGGGSGSLCRLFVALCACCRVGEASHPGPVVHSPNQWHLGLCNPTGVNSKYDQVAHLEGDIWLMCESHLTKQGFHLFRKGTALLDSPYKYLVPGAPCQPRSQSDVGGFSGVLTLSRYPARPLPHAFDKELYDTARLQVSGVCVGGMWITMGLVYGFPHSPQYPNRTYQTECLLDEVVRRVAGQTKGLRVIAGDLNHGPTELHQLAILRSYGFRELQEIALTRWGREVVATGRGSKNIDQVWLSPELQTILLDVQLEDDIWADHLTVSGIFASQNTPLVESRWRMPAPFPWPAEDGFSPQVVWEDDLTVQYASFWFQLESNASDYHQQHGSKLSKQSMGRGATLAPKKCWSNDPPCRVGRQCLFRCVKAALSMVPSIAACPSAIKDAQIVEWQTNPS